MSSAPGPRPGLFGRFPWCRAPRQTRFSRNSRAAEWRRRRGLNTSGDQHTLGEAARVEAFPPADPGGPGRRAGPAHPRPRHHRRAPAPRRRGLPRLRRADPARPQPLRARPRRSALAGPARAAARPGAAVPLPPPVLPAADLRRTPGGCRGGPARRTERLGGLQRHLGLALGGEAGARLAERSPCLPAPTRCCAGRRAPVRRRAPAPTPRVLAVDDWAWRRGHRYGTVLVDLERNRVVDLLPDRQAETLAAWLRAHPGVEVVAGTAPAPTRTARARARPRAVQVADRWRVT